MSMISRDRSARLMALACSLLLLSGCGAGTSQSASASASEAAATASAAMSPGELPIDAYQDLSAGSHSFSHFPVGITFEIPAVRAPETWFSCSESAVEQAVCYEWADESHVAVTFQIVENVAAACSDQDSAKLLDPPVGPSVGDLVTAISNLESYSATDPVDITVDGFAGKEFTLTAPDTEGCGATWSTSDRVTGMGPGEINLLRAIDVEGVRVLISGAYGTETPESVRDAFRKVMDSVQIER